MIFVDDILTYFRGLGHAAEYGTLAQLNEQLTNVDYAASTDGMVAFVRLIGEQRTVDGHDQCDIAVHLSWLCPLDFDGETMLSTQEQAKDTLKVWINHIRGGNTVTVSEDARWQFGYDDFAENVAWVAVRVTLTSAAADCVPLRIPTADYFYLEAAQPSSTVAFMDDYSVGGQFAAKDLEWSRDGSVWHAWNYTTSQGTTGGYRHTFDALTLANVGDRIYLRGDNYEFGNSSSADASVFLLSGRMRCGGDIRSIFTRDLSATVARFHPAMCAYDGDHFALLNAPDIRVWRAVARDAFNGFLAYCEAITELPSDYLPWTVLDEGCYRGMFMQSGIRKAPVLPAFIVPSRSYAYMFWYCANLDEIEAHATELEEGATTNMAAGVAEDGVFRKAAEMEGWPQGVDGIPDGWTVENL